MVMQHCEYIQGKCAAYLKRIYDGKLHVMYINHSKK